MRAVTSAIEQNEIAIVYGAIADPAAAARYALAELRRSGTQISTGAAIIAPGSPALRINTRGWLDVRPQLAGGLKTHQDRIAFCKAGLAKSVSLFTAGLAAFLDDYVRLIEQVVEEERDLLEERLVAMGLPADNPVLGYRDWIFSAFLPLPNAYIQLPDTSDTGAVSFARLDCVFWTGDALLAILFDTHNMPRASERRAHERLEQLAPCIEVLRTQPTGLRDRTCTAKRARQALSGFARDVAIPHGLFRLGALPTPAGVAV